VSEKFNVVSFSGGRSSAYLVYLTQALGMNCSYIFMDTGAEHPATYKFIRDLVQHWGINLICLRVKYNPELGVGNSYSIVPVADIGPDYEPWRGMLTKYGAPSVQSPYCTSRMKTEPHDKYCNDVFGAGNYITWLGIRADEPQREGYLSSKPTIKTCFPFKEDGLVRDDIINILNESGLGLPKYYEWRSRSGCYFCFYQKKIEWIGLQENHPELFEAAKSYEKTDEKTGKRYTWTNGGLLLVVFLFPCGC